MIATEPLNASSCPLFNVWGNSPTWFGRGCRVSDSGTFTAHGELGSQSGRVIDLAAADLDGDGAPDVAAIERGQSGGALTLLHNRGDRRLERRALPAGLAAPVRLLALDVDGDGRCDLTVLDVGPAGDGTVRVLLNGGDGQFTAEAQVHDGGLFANNLALADMDQDGLVDLVLADKSGFSGGLVSVYRNAGGGRFEPRPAVHASAQGQQGLLAADLNADGRPDLVLTRQLNASVSSPYNVTLLLNQAE